MSPSPSSLNKSNAFSAGVVIAAAGSGSRIAGPLHPGDSPVAKQWLPLGDVPLIVHSFRFFDRWDGVDQIVVALDAESLSSPERLALLQSSHGKTVRFAAGGSRRQESVWAALQRLDPIPTIAMIHDAARPFPPREAIARAVIAAREVGGAILAARLYETIKRVNEGMEVVETLDRGLLWRAQTPQVFRAADLIAAYRRQEKRLDEFTDDAAVFEASGGTIRIVESPESNFKITLPEDFARAERMLPGIEDL